MRTTHILKTWPTYWNQVETGEKTFEVRKNDRNFQIGDTVELRRFDPEADDAEDFAANPQDYPVLRFDIGSMIIGPQFGIEDGWAVLSLVAHNPEQTDGE